MKRYIFRVAVALLALMTGMLAQVVWESKRQIIDTCADFVLNWQD